ncbi:hypothetical protein [Absidia glauca]|uniref:CHY-type domain-containing protein n=1 Tax=Absidia glauca TaxID=4829 RepID=A0A168RXU7_ABSGL|nr:hypothetical protein [Absidia glauca]
MCNMINLRKRVLEIHQDDLLCSKEKSRRIQQLLAPHHSPLPPLQHESTEYVQSYHDKETNKLGCKHYARNVKIQADCCQKIFPCRHCHDEESDHALIRSEIKTMLCMICKRLQPAAQDCMHCKTRASKYYCSTCHLWTDAPSYHCDACGLCRAGQRTDFSHCDRCNACIRVDAKDSHPCLDRSLESDCPICIQDLFTSTTPVIIMVQNAVMLCIRLVVKTIYVQPPTNARSARNPSET